MTEIELINEDPLHCDFLLYLKGLVISMSHNLYYNLKSTESQEFWFT